MQLKFTLFFVVFSCLCLGVHAQSVSLKGQVINATTQASIQDAFVSIQNTNKITTTDVQGNFILQDLVAGEQAVMIELNGYKTYTEVIVLRNNEILDLGIIALEPASPQIDPFEDQDVIPTITLNESALSGSEALNQNISGLLFASRDIFFNTAAFNFSAARFRIRGYDSENTTVMLNGMPMNKLETGRVLWSDWAGLNDVTRGQDITIGIGASDHAFGGVGGVIDIDTRASNQRKTFRFSYSLSNRTYRNRVMATYNTGMLPGNWAISISGSRRWSDEGYIDATYYDAYSYFIAVDKKIGRNHLLGFTFLGAPAQRGKSGAVTQEVYDLAGNNFMNPYWGFQAGEKRNSRIADTHRPIAMLRHDWDINTKSKLTAVASYQFGKNGNTAIDWVNARDPRPDYYQRLPSFARNRSDIQDSIAVADAIRSNPTFLTIDWASMINANRFGKPVTIQNANGSGTDFTGKRAKYIIEERRLDGVEANANLIFKSYLTDRLTLNAGGTFQYTQSENFKIVKDLLGADFYLDIDKFRANDPTRENNVDQPNRIVGEGERFDYDYLSNVRKASGWLQLVYTLPRFDFFLAGQTEATAFWREGNVRNGKFPLGNDSFGQSEVSEFLTYAAKGGVTYKLDGRNYFHAGGFYGTRAPFYQNALTSPRTRNEIVPRLEVEQITSGEIGYNYRSPYFKAKATAYYTQFANGSDIQNFFIVEPSIGNGNFIFLTMTDIDKLHFGGEIAAEARIYKGLSINAIAAIGQYTYTSRPKGTVYVDSELLPRVTDRTIYMKNFYLGGTPQQAYALGLRYSGKKFWFANLTFNYFDEIWIDFNPLRRTEQVVEDIDRNSSLFRSIIYQEKAASNYTLDFFGGKSFKLASNYFLNLTLGVNNILNNKNFITGGYEQGRFEFDANGNNRFPNRYFYMFGLNYFMNATFRVNI